MKYFVAIISIIIIVGCGAPEDKPMQWKKLPLPTSENITGIDFPSDNLGYLVTEVGSVLKTTDGGATCTALSLRAGTRLEDACFLSDDEGFVFGRNGFMARTGDGGQTWEKLDFDQSCWLKSMGVLDDEHWFLAGVLDDPEQTFTGIVGTSEDEGATWTFDTTEYRGFDYVDILKDDHLFISGVGFVYYSSDKGENWQHNFTGNRDDSLSGLFFANIRYGWGVGSGGLLLHTTDGGWSWDRQEKLTTKDLNCVTAPEIATIYLAGDHIIAASRTNGRDWEVDTLSYSVTFNDFHWTGDEIYLCGSEGALLKLIE